ncbi:hypothetical protein [Hymenobacter norwichensis]|uniref:hypothetical protein n=1 Tax=Hymenobacter norwichensis TaxID=223903 RepID=UPI0003B4BA93|nr:hypothetical protein [Hymenobacter norwichensis]
MRLLILFAGLLLSIVVPAVEPPFRLTRVTQQTFLQQAQQAPVAPLRLRNRLTKQHGVLRIPLRNGRYKVLADKHPNTDDVEQVRYTYRGYLLDFKQHLISVEYYETGEWLLVSEEGNTLVLWSEPLSSPDRTKLVTYAGNLDYEMMPTGLQLFQLVQGQLVRQWEHKEMNWNPQRLFWRTNQQLYLQAEMPAELVPSGKAQTLYQRISLP